MSDAIPIRRLDDDQAIEWLRDHSPVEVTVSDLARRWAWSRRTAQRRLHAWAGAGVIKRETLPGGASLITLCAPAHLAAHPAHALAQAPARRAQSAAHPPAPAVGDDNMHLSVAAAPAHVPMRSVRTLPTTLRNPRTVRSDEVVPATKMVPAATDRTDSAPSVVEPLSGSASGVDRRFRLVGALILAGIAFGIAWIGVQVNSWYGATLGRTPEAAGLFAWLSIAADALALALPSAAGSLWTDGRHGLAYTAWGVWGITFAMALMASIGFVSLNIADTAAARTRVADQSAGLAQRLERLRAERAVILEPRAVAAIEAELQRAQPHVAPDVWRDTRQCADVTLKESGQACAEVLKLRGALATAHRREVLDAELAKAEAKLSILPAVTTADPQAATASRLIGWASFGMLKMTADDVAMVRVLGMVLLPQPAGLVLMLATALVARLR